jgi:hypothetical protein
MNRIQPRPPQPMIVRTPVTHHREAARAAAAAVDEHRRRHAVATGFTAIGLLLGTLGNLA